MKKMILELSKDWDTLSPIFKNDNFDVILEDLKNIGKYDIIKEFNERNDNISSDNDAIEFILELVKNGFDFSSLKNDATKIIDYVDSFKLDNIHKAMINLNKFDLVDILLNLSNYIDNINKGKLLYFIKKHENLNFKRISYFKDKFEIKGNIDYELESLYGIDPNVFYCKLLYIIENLDIIKDMEDDNKNLLIKAILLSVIYLYDIKSKSLELYNKIISNGSVIDNIDTNNTDLKYLIAIYSKNINKIINL